MENAVIQNVWQAITPELEAEIIQFWLDQKALTSAEEAKQRVAQVAFVARDTNNRLVGISSAYRQFNEQLGNYFYYLRMFVASSARNTSIGKHLSLALNEFFEARFKEGHDPEVIGLFSVVENKFFQKTFNMAIWPHPYAGFVYIGKNANGDHLRVYYFEGARIS